MSTRGRKTALTARWTLLLALPFAVMPAAASAQAFDHSAFDELLKKDVVKGMVDYDAFAEAGSFKKYLASLDAADPSKLPDKERLAFWIDAYNAYTIELVNAHDERASIKKINEAEGLIRARGPWKQPVVKVGGRTYSLDEVENDVIRKQFPEPRVHFALVCAAMSCPLLRSEAYTGAKLDAQLDSQARLFLLDAARGSHVDVKDGVVRASRILDWYKEDFGGSDEAIGRFIALYHSESPEKQLLLSGHFKMEFLEYDWRLNSRLLARLKE